MSQLSVREVTASYGELVLVEQAAMDLLAGLGWTVKNLYGETFGDSGTEGRVSERQVVLPRRLRAALELLNPGLPLDAYAQAVEQLTQDRSKQMAVNANRELYRLLKDGVKVKVTNEAGAHTIETLRVIDWATPGHNDFFLTSQMWVAGDMYRRRCDLVAFVNGLPLVFIELKKPSVPLKSAYDANLRDYKGQSVPQLFHPNAFILLSNGSDTRVGTLSSAWEHFFDWKRVEDEDELVSKGGQVSLARALRGLLEPTRLLDYVENFTVFEEGKGGLIKKTAKNHQFLGVNKSIARLIELREPSSPALLPEGEGSKSAKRLGVFWHTQGSGKSLSMVFFTQKVLRRVLGSCTFVIVTDREELDDQISKTFKATGATAREDVRATSGAHLKELLGGNERYIFTLIQKFRNEPGQPYPQLSSRSDVIVITDEAHRSQYDIFALNMRNALPNAGFLGFTGTPLIKGDDERTREVFGDYVSVYDFARSIEDGATVPLYYENRIPEVQLTNDDLNQDLENLLEAAELDEDQEKKLEREFGREYHIITREDRLDAIARDLVTHFTGRGYRGKAMMVCIDKATAVRMYDKVQAHWQTEMARLKSALTPAQGDAREALLARIHLMTSTDMAVVVSQGQNEVEDLAKKGLNIAVHRQRMLKENLAEQFKAADAPLRLVFVCAMWITGFDVPTCSTIYLDKPMRAHTLMQTIARANRVAPGKESGLIVDYVGIFRALQNALAIYAQPGTTGSEAGAPILDKTELVAALRVALDEADSFAQARGVALAGIAAAQGFERIGLIDDAVEAFLGSEADKKRYLQLASRVARLFKAILPDPMANELAPLSVLVAYLAAKIKAETEQPDICAVLGDVEDLLNDSIATEGYRIGPASRAQALINLSEIDFEALQAKFAQGHQRTEVQKLKRLIEGKLAAMLKLNAARVDLAEKFQKLIDAYNAGSQNIEDLFAELKKFVQVLSNESQRGIAEGLSEEELALFDILTKPEPVLTKAEQFEVKKVCRALLETLRREKLVFDWREKQQTKAAVMQTLKMEMRRLPLQYTKDIRDEKFARAYAHVYDHYYGAGLSAYGAAV
ncbi:MAG: type I restriction endonuclease subunit R [Gammaproteobacteria bacterium]|uniref:type I restriction endonuclease subunit R n=1 Tax=Rhodoferax sp. TaxID=50421 RepID=UPI0017DD6A2C|nr:type I restriction endonuclease subunit R [Rhodoferax sp.]MBU3900671.1 type I restriction endonuclease subunit R [Gammaproteobacteria bacterium]MBA3058125.1 type I restriction endonuclease subunit R [Rhodoferax sp.]MBU3998403.1 type I restriction endonuclease subunit R [Gammaproteobacteria bacterium]MBU4081329.1 type I restriction endonuclease subunit R [Gammaproteobacteria bacterium]MBU4114517.1 type I restriction endonuclease subunit R [Gammaproteobacteria bacterium]